MILSLELVVSSKTVMLVLEAVGKASNSTENPLWERVNPDTWM